MHSQVIPTTNLNSLHIDVTRLDWPRLPADQIKNIID